MSTLRQRAEQAARDIDPEAGVHDHEGVYCPDCVRNRLVADAIERVVREFAERACENVIAFIQHAARNGDSPEVFDVIATAIAEAEKEI